jgi:hypothetical protein
VIVPIVKPPNAIKREGKSLTIGRSATLLNKKDLIEEDERGKKIVVPAIGTRSPDSDRNRDG